MTETEEPSSALPTRPIRAGLYVHLPYCRSRCGYCSFVVSTEDSSRSAYLAALSREIELVASEADRADFDSVYLGGGTPSLLPGNDLARLLDEVRAGLRVVAGAEFTLEANPEDVTREAVEVWARAGVTRVSAGVQSLADRELSAVNRRHNAGRAAGALSALAEAGLSVSADLILGLPHQTAETFRTSVAGVCAQGVEHLSVYLLEAEKSKTIQDDRQSHPERYLAEDAQADLWLELGETLSGLGFLHYEISNWALPGKEARHNVKYWKREPTLGLGVAAHELWAERRRANTSVLPQYIEKLEGGRRPTASDLPVGSQERSRERIVLGLRLSDGVEKGELEARVFGSRDRTLREDYSSWRAEGLLHEEQGRVRFTERGFLLSNEILCRFV